MSGICVTAWSFAKAPASSRPRSLMFFAFLSRLFQMHNTNTRMTRTTPPTTGPRTCADASTGTAASAAPLDCSCNPDSGISGLVGLSGADGGRWCGSGERGRGTAGGCGEFGGSCGSGEGCCGGGNDGGTGEGCSGGGNDGGIVGGCFGDGTAGGLGCTHVVSRMHCALRLGSGHANALPRWWCAIEQSIGCIDRNVAGSVPLRRFQKMLKLSCTPLSFPMDAGTVPLILLFWIEKRFSRAARLPMASGSVPLMSLLDNTSAPLINRSSERRIGNVPRKLLSSNSTESTWRFALHERPYHIPGPDVSLHGCPSNQLSWRCQFDPLVD